MVELCSRGLQLRRAATRCQANPTLSSAPPSPLSLQNKEFVCRGHDYERLEAFQQRMLNEFPHAIAMQHVNQPDQTIYQADAQCILDCTGREAHDEIRSLKRGHVRPC